MVGLLTFLPARLAERRGDLMGGNAEINGYRADVLDLRYIEREVLQDAILEELHRLNEYYYTTFGNYLWPNNILKDRKIFSGSSEHFFDEDISDEDFIAHKPQIGDIDLQVDKNLEPHLRSLLFLMVSDVGSPIVGCEKSASQYITMWRIAQMNVQIDFECVDCVDYTGMPTDWSRFSHSSSWIDIEHGIKGVFHKYMLRAFTAHDLKDRIVMTGKRQTMKRMMVSDLAFSVSRGLRQKIEFIKNDSNGVPIYREIPVSESTYFTEPSEIFKILFGFEPSSDDSEMFVSFIGCVKLANKYMTDEQRKSLIKGFIHTLFGHSAQRISRSKNEDFRFKKVALEYLKNNLHGSCYDYSYAEELIRKYYEGY